ncbi:AarF/ABC1/UbiB kinase family protein [Candidatus Woesearchaeota archaeon]|nr:AarF/ABC1/UbiB kinase family protein [Candidatus Woesearchaeota archaeon]
MFTNIRTAYRDLRRLRQIVGVLLKNELGYYVEKMQLKHHVPGRMRTYKTDKPNSMPYRLRNAFEELGPVFIKLGQFLSLRPDLIPKEYCDEFAKLQDSIESFSYETALELIEKELKRPWNEVFLQISKQPIASASIGQVHKARLLNGEIVVIKIQRPDIKEVIETDINLIYHLAELAKKHISNLNDYDLNAIVQEFERYTNDEMNYYIEAKNIEKFYHNFTGSKTIKIPKLYNDYTTKKILVMEFIDGIKIDNLEQFDKFGYDRHAVSHNVAQAMLKQVFEYGLFHADPHPANIFVLNGNKIAFLDYGIVGRISEETKEKLARLFLALVHKNMDRVADSFLQLGIMEQENPRIKEALLLVLEDYGSLAIKEVKIGNLFNELVNMSWKYKLKLPVDFVLLAKAIATSEGFGQKLDPDFKLGAEMSEYAREYIDRNGMTYRFKKLKDTLNKLGDNIIILPDRIDKLLSKAEKGEIKIDVNDRDVKKLGTDINTSSNRLTMGLIIAALIIGGALVLRMGDYDIFAYFAFLMAGVLGLLLIISVIRE